MNLTMMMMKMMWANVQWPFDALKEIFCVSALVMCSINSFELTFVLARASHLAKMLVIVFSNCVVLLMAYSLLLHFAAFEDWHCQLDLFWVGLVSNHLLELIGSLAVFSPEVGFLPSPALLILSLGYCCDYCCCCYCFD